VRLAEWVPVAKFDLEGSGSIDIWEGVVPVLGLTPSQGADAVADQEDPWLLSRKKLRDCAESGAPFIAENDGTPVVNENCAGITVNAKGTLAFWPSAEVTVALAT
jgi:hypothetical protein